MKKVLIVIVVAAIAVLLVLFALPRIEKNRALSGGKAIKVLLVYNPEYERGKPSVLAAYESVLQEEGVPFESIDVYQLSTLNVDDFVKRVPVMILPDGILVHVPAQFGEWTKEYLSKGGNVAVIYDAGTRHQKGYFLDRSVFADIVGLNYITFSTSGAQAFGHANIKFVSGEARDFFQVPMGKTLDGLVLSGYGYGALRYPVAENKPVRELPKKDIYAYAVKANNEKFPAVVLTGYAAGKVLYVDLPLGALKADSDDLPLRSALRTFLFDVGGIPHVMNVEDGKGGLVINWHIDYDEELTNLPRMIAKGYLRKSLKASLHITAGEFNDAPGDGSGFDACGKGRTLTRELMEYGKIGSHGGWAHNWFARNINDGRFGEKEIAYYIQKNNDCLKSITGYPIDEYSAPDGVHPQPATTKSLERFGEVAYYANSDTGSAPNRVFIDGKMVSSAVISFPIMPFGKSASFWEMQTLDHRSPAEMKEWFHNTLDYIVRHRTVRLIYSHPYNIKHYPAEIMDFINTADKMQKDNRLTARPMSDFARFFLRFLKTTYDFSEAANGLAVSLTNSEGLAGITVAVPKAHYSPPSEKGYAITEDGRYFYVTITGNETKNSFLCTRR